MPNVANLIYIHQIYNSKHLPDGSHFLLASRGAKANWRRSSKNGKAVKRRHWSKIQAKKENNQLKSCHNTSIKQEFVVLHNNIIFMHISGSNHYTCITNEDYNISSPS